MATVLVADDSEVYRRLAALVLGQAGHHVLLARSGREALEVARTALPDVILCDVLMPEGDGLATLRALKSEGTLRHIPVYLLTGSDQEGDLDAGEIAAAAGLLTKPFSAASLLAAVGGQARL